MSSTWNRIHDALRSTAARRTSSTLPGRAPVASTRNQVVHVKRVIVSVVGEFGITTASVGSTAVTPLPITPVIGTGAEWPGGFASALSAKPVESFHGSSGSSKCSTATYPFRYTSAGRSSTDTVFDPACT